VQEGIPTRVPPMKRGTFLHFVRFVHRHLGFVFSEARMSVRDAVNAQLGGLLG